MKNLLSLVLVLALMAGLAGCSKLRGGKRAYNKGDYRKAEELLNKHIKRFGNDLEAQKYLVLTQSGIITDSAAGLVKAGNLAAALPMLERALSLNDKNEDARNLLNTSVTSLTEKILNKLVPAGDWSEVLSTVQAVGKYLPDNPALASASARAVVETEQGRPTWKTVLAVRRGLLKVPDDPFLKPIQEKLDAASRDFMAAHLRLESSIINKNYKQWRGLLNARYSRECETDVKKLIERSDPYVRSVENYFEVITHDFEKYGAPQGSEVVCIEPLSPDQGFVHYTFPKLPKILKREFQRAGGALKADREQDSEIRLTDLK